jgi:hypothetical protein
VRRAKGALNSHNCGRGVVSQLQQHHHQEAAVEPAADICAMAAAMQRCSGSVASCSRQSSVVPGVRGPAAVSRRHVARVAEVRLMVVKSVAGPSSPYGGLKASPDRHLRVRLPNWAMGLPAGGLGTNSAGSARRQTSAAAAAAAAAAVAAPQQPSVARTGAQPLCCELQGPRVTTTQLHLCAAPPQH